MINVVAPAKINLFLRICGKNNAGYHLLDSLVAFTEYGDNLTIYPADKDELVLTGEFASTINAQTRNNLIIRALNAFRQNGGFIGPVRIVLEKKIPEARWPVLGRLWIVFTKNSDWNVEPMNALKFWFVNTELD